MGNEPRQTAGKPQGMWRRAFPVTASLVIPALGSGYSVSMLKPEPPRSPQEDRMKTLVTLLALTVSVAAPALAQDRMPPIPAEKMTEAQKKAVADYKSIRNTDLVAPPWTVLLRVPDLVVPALQLRLHNQQNSALSPKLTELAILIAARHLTNSFEWNAHYTLAVQALAAEDRRASLGLGDAKATGSCAFASQDVSVTTADVSRSSAWPKA